MQITDFEFEPMSMSPPPVSKNGCLKRRRSEHRRNLRNEIWEESNYEKIDLALILMESSNVERSKIDKINIKNTPHAEGKIIKNETDTLYNIVEPTENEKYKENFLDQSYKAHTNFNIENVIEVATSWDLIKAIPNCDETFSKILFERTISNVVSHNISDSYLMKLLFGECIIGDRNMYDLYPNKAFAKFSFQLVRLIDMAVDMLGPDLDTFEEILIEIGSKIAHYGLDSKYYNILGKTLIETIEIILGREKFASFTKYAWKSIYSFLLRWITKGVKRSLSEKI